MARVSGSFRVGIYWGFLFGTLVFPSSRVARCRARWAFFAVWFDDCFLFVSSAAPGAIGITYVSSLIGTVEKGSIMLFESKIKVNQLRKQMIVLECDTQRLLIEERWRDLRGRVGLGGRAFDGESGRWQRLATLVVPVGAFLLTRWFRRKETSSGQGTGSSSGAFLSLLASVFDWMGRYHRS